MLTGISKLLCRRLKLDHSLHQLWLRSTEYWSDDIGRERSHFSVPVSSSVPTLSPDKNTTPGGIRTHDFQIRSLARCPLRHGGNDCSVFLLKSSNARIADESFFPCKCRASAGFIMGTEPDPSTLRFVVCQRSDDDAAWQRLLRERMSRMTTHHGVKNKVCCDIDFRFSAPFYRRDVARVDIVLECYRGDTLSGFAMLKTTLSVSCLYLVLMCSMERGVGRQLIKRMLEDHTHAHRYLVTRSTDRALGFYLRLGFQLFNWFGTESYATLGDAQLTERLRAAKTADMRTALRVELNARHWTEPDEEEWPLILCRQCSTSDDAIPRPRRQSSRLIQMAAECTFRD